MKHHDREADALWSEGDGGRQYLRQLPVLKGAGPGFDPDHAPSEPVSLFVAWLREAADAGVVEPHAMTLSTIDPDGFPQARVLILKAVDAQGWHFAVSSASRKGLDLAAHPAAALTFYWTTLVRQIRISGTVIRDGIEASAADFLARPIGSRAMALTLRQSQPLNDPAEVDTELEKAYRRLADDPGLVPDEWISYAVQPALVEFWEGATDRRHQRLRYRRDGTRWERELLWP